MNKLEIPQNNSTNPFTTILSSLQRREPTRNSKIKLPPQSCHPDEGRTSLETPQSNYPHKRTNEQTNYKLITHNSKLQTLQLPYQKSIQLTLWIMIPTSYFGKRNFSLLA